MSLTERVRRLQKEAFSDRDRKSAALERAEKLAEKFADVRPTPVAMPMEKYFGTPAFHHGKGGCD